MQHKSAHASYFIFILLNVLDCIITISIISQGGVEIMPVASIVFTTMGPVGLLVFKLVGAAAFGYLLQLFRYSHLLVVVNTLMFLVCLFGLFSLKLSWFAT